MIEVELKVRVPSLDAVRRNLVRHNAEFSGRVHERDIYYNAPHRNFSRTDEALRVRSSGGRVVVTYKGPKMKGLDLKAREELNTAVESGEVFSQILARLGFVQSAEVTKWREHYRFRNASVALDEVEHLGSFVEIEVLKETDASGAAKTIDRIAEELGIEGEPILASYLELLLATR